MNGFFSLQGLFYLVISYLHIRKHTKAVRDFYSDLEKVKLQYIQIFIVLHIILNLSMTLCYIVLPTQVVEYFCIPLFIDILYVFIVYYAFNHSAILTSSDYCNLVQNMEPLNEFKDFADPLCAELKEMKKNNGQSKHKLTNIEIEDNYKKILDYFQNQKPYLDPAINLTRLSNMLNACSHNISLTINSKFGMNFFDLINSYRVEEAKILLKNIENNKLTIEGCGYNAGFNSKMAFYRAFKKYVRMTPSEFISLHKNQF
jgi:AraC-like DNA-binding protein